MTAQYGDNSNPIDLKGFNQKHITDQVRAITSNNSTFEMYFSWTILKLIYWINCYGLLSHQSILSLSADSSFHSEKVINRNKTTITKTKDRLKM